MVEVSGVFTRYTSEKNNKKMWDHWNVLKKNIEFTSLDEFDGSIIPQNEDVAKIYGDMHWLECVGIGELVKLTASQLVFRIRPTSNDNENIFIKLGHPSIYESMIEIVYYFNVDAPDIRFEVRTIGVLSRACNALFSRELSLICTEKSKDSNIERFNLDIKKICKSLVSINYNEKILEWYPRTCKKMIIDDTDLHLRIKKRYDVCVYKFEFMDVKFMPRINMILSWMKELEMKGGFILSDSKSLTKNTKHYSGGYMILGGDNTNDSESNKSDMSVFQERFKCLHWKKTKHYHYSNHDFISQIDYDDIPKNYFCLTYDNIGTLNDEKDKLFLYKILDNI